jgi:drug/metabolite transporter (DMT)-like permease
MLFGNMVWGIMAPISKNVMLSGLVSPIALSAIRILGAAIVFFIMGFFLPRSIAPREKVEKHDYFKLFLASVLMISLNQGLYILGVGLTSPVDATVMCTLTPIFTMILAAIFIAMPITWMKAAGVAIGLGGALLLVLSDTNSTAESTNPILGDLMCLGAQLCAALYYVLFRDMTSKYAPWTMMKWMFWFSALTYVPICLPSLREVDYAALPAHIWWSIAYIIIFSSFIGYLLIPFSQRLLKPTVVSMYTYFQPVFAAILAAILGMSFFGPTKIFATILIFVGVAFVTRSRGGDQPTPAKS